MTEPPQRVSKTLRAKISRRIAKGSFFRDMGMLLAGSGAAQVITLASAPILVRLFSPSEFAALALLTASLQIISRLSSFKFETAIATGRNRLEMGALAALATWALGIITFVSMIGCALLFDVIERRVGPVSAVAFCIALPLVVWFSGIIQIIITWSVRWKEFRTVAANDLVRNGSSTLTQVGAGLAGLNSAGLLFGQVVGTAIALGVLVFRRSARELYALARRTSWRQRKAVARRFADFPLFQMPKAIIFSMALNMPTILVAAFYSAAATGLFFFALRLTTLPAQLISTSLGRVLMQRYADLWNTKRKRLTKLLTQSTLFFLIPAIPLGVTLFFFSVPIFVLVLGEPWRMSGEIAVWTGIWSAAIIVGTPAQMALTVMRQNRVMLVLEILFLPARLIPFPWFAASGDLESATQWCSFVAVAYNATMIATAWSRSRTVPPGFAGKTLFRGKAR